MRVRWHLGLILLVAGKSIIIIFIFLFYTFHNYFFKRLSLLIINEPRHEKNLFLPHANNKDADQPAHPRSLISAFVIRCINSIIPLVSIPKISSLQLAEQVGLSLTWSQTPKTWFLVTRLIYYHHFWLTVCLDNDSAELVCYYSSVSGCSNEMNCLIESLLRLVILCVAVVFQNFLVLFSRVMQFSRYSINENEHWEVFLGTQTPRH